MSDPSCAYVTLLTKADYLPGVRALIRSLHYSDARGDIVVMHTPNLGWTELGTLAALGARLIAVSRPALSAEFEQRHERAQLHGAAPYTKGVKPGFHTPLDNFSKLRLWQLGYERIIYLDADTLVLRNIDRLFGYPDFCAAPNVYRELNDFHRLNSGVFTVRPNPEIYDRMLAELDAPGRFWRRTDQTFLEHWFPDWYGLPIIYNLLQYVWLNLPQLWNWNTIKVLHFQYEKPWDAPHDKSERLRPLTDLWWAFHDGIGPPDLARMPSPA